MESIRQAKAARTRATGSTISSKARVKNIGPTTLQTMSVSSTTARSRVRASTCGPMDRRTRVTGSTIASMASASTHGRMVESTTASGTTTTCKALEFINTQTVSCTKDSTSRTRRWATVSTSGLMSVSMKVTGLRVNSTVSASTQTPRRELATDCGSTARDSSGTTRKPSSTFSSVDTM